MMRYLAKLVRTLVPSGKSRRAATPLSAGPDLESLEGRALMSASPVLVLPHAYPTDPCAVAVLRPGVQVTLNPQPLPPAPAPFVLRAL